MKMGFVEKYIRDNWEILFDRKKPLKISMAKVYSRPHPETSISFLIFTEDSVNPAYVIKLNRDPEYDMALVAEYDNFCCIRGMLAATKGSVPRPVFFKRINFGHTCYCQTALEGKKLGYDTLGAVFMAPKLYSVRSMVDSSFKWLGMFHKETFSRFEVLDGHFADRYLRLPAESTSNKIIGEVSGIIRKRYTGAGVPVASVHGDYTYFNILFNNNDVNIVDWEDCRKEGLPFTDIFFFIAQLGMNFYPSLSPVDSFRKFFRKDSETAKMIDGALSAYSRITSLDTQLVYCMFPFFISGMMGAECGFHRDPRSYLFLSGEMLDAVASLTMDRAKGWA